MDDELPKSSVPESSVPVTPEPVEPVEPRAPNSPEGSQVIAKTGRRKTSIARVRLVPGSGTIKINDKPYDQYFTRESLRFAIREPLLLARQLGKYDIFANVVGGGHSGQAGAIRLGIARALLQVDETLRSGLRGGGLLTRDPRMKERKKYGQKGARKRFQWTKR